jgi:hypothetical protein
MEFYRSCKIKIKCGRRCIRKLKERGREIPLDFAENYFGPTRLRYSTPSESDSDSGSDIDFLFDNNNIANKKTVNNNNTENNNNTKNNNNTENNNTENNNNTDCIKSK